MGKYNFFKQSAMRRNEEQRILTKQFYNKAYEIYERFDDWKDLDRFYFIPLYLEMTYSVNGMVLEMAPDPVWMGSFVQCSLDHPGLFQFKCHRCKSEIFPFRYVGSALSGRVDLEYKCKCGKKGYESVSGWRIRATALRDQLARDEVRKSKFIQDTLGGDHPADINELLNFLNKEKI